MPKNSNKPAVAGAASGADREIGFAIVGCGNIGPWHAGAIARVDGARLVACVDLDRAKAQKVARGYTDLLKQAGITKAGGNAVPAISTSYARMMSREDVDVVCLCVPSGDHARVGIAAANAGKHVFSEKPLDITLANMDALVAAARSNNVKLAAVFQRRFTENAILIKQAIDSGKFGKILQADCSVNWYRSQEYYDSGAWRGTWDLDGGGCLMNQGVHGIDLLQWFAGPVAWIQAWCATTERKRIEVETQAIAIAGFASGAHGVIQGSTVCYPGDPVVNRIAGTKGAARLEDSRLAAWNFLKPSADDKSMLETANEAAAKPVGGDQFAVLGAPGDSHYPQVKDLVEAIREDREPQCTGEDARHAVEIILAIYESARRGGEKIFLPLEGDTPAVGFSKDAKRPKK